MNQEILQIVDGDDDDDDNNGGAGGGSGGGVDTFLKMSSKWTLCILCF